MNEVKENVRALDNVVVTLTDEVTGNKRVFSSHNAPLNYHFKALASWVGWINNFGQNPVVPPSLVSLGNGGGVPSSSDTGLFSALAGTSLSMSYCSPNVPASGTTTFIFQYSAGVVTTQVTEALLSDTNGNNWAHTMFTVPFTPTAGESITVQWEMIYS